MKHIFNGHSDYQTQVYQVEREREDIWAIRYQREKSNRLKSSSTPRRSDWEEFRINFSEVPFLSNELLSKLKMALTAIAMKVVPETLLIYKTNIFKALTKVEVDGLISMTDDHVSSDSILAYWDQLSKYERESLRALNNYDSAGFFDKDISPLISIVKADNYSKRFRSIMSPDAGTLTHQEATRMLLGARNALDQGVIDIKDAVLLFLVYEAGQRISSFEFLRWKDFYCVETGAELSWFVDLYVRKGAVEKSPSRISNTTAMLIKAYYQLYEEHARKMGVSEDLSGYQIFIRNSLNGDLFMDSDHVYGWDSGVGAERLAVRLNEILKKLDVSNRVGKPLQFNSNRARHTGATFRVCEGASVKEVQLFLRHRNPFTAQVYVDVASSEIAALIDNAFEGVIETARELARRATDRPLLVDTSKVITFFNPHTDEIETGGSCGYQKRCGDAPFSCVTGCDKFQPFNDAPFDVLLETLKQEFNDYINNTTSNALTSEYHEAVAKLQAFVDEMKVENVIDGAADDC